jgi:hypothetical protein
MFQHWDAILREFYFRTRAYKHNMLIQVKNDPYWHEGNAVST